MIWALLAILGVPLWLIVGLLAGVVLSRRNFRRQDGVFALKVRSEGAAKWPRTLIYGRQVRDVLVTTRGAALLRTEFHAVDEVADLALADRPKKPTVAVGRLVTLADGTRLEVAVSGRDAAHVDALALARQQDRDGKECV